MDWSTLGAIGEFAGGIAVIVTLFYLALQLRQNTRSLSASAYSQTQTQLSNWFGPIVHDPELLALFNKCLESRSSLDEAETRRFDALMLDFVFPMEDMFHL